MIPTNFIAIVIDGKLIRHSQDKELSKSMLHSVEFKSVQPLTISGCQSADQKANVKTAIHKLLKSLPSSSTPLAVIDIVSQMEGKGSLRSGNRQAPQTGEVKREYFDEVQESGLNHKPTTDDKARSTRTTLLLSSLNP